MDLVALGAAALLALAAVAVAVLLTRTRGAGALVAAETRLGAAQSLIAGLTAERDAARAAERGAAQDLAVARQRLADGERRSSSSSSSSRSS